MPEPGEVIAEWEWPVDWTAARAFARAVQDPGWDDRSPVAPPTFAVTVSADMVERLIVERLRLDRSRTVHGEQSYRYFGPLPIGGRVRARARLIEDAPVAGRRGGRMRRIVTETEIRDAESGALLILERMTALERAP